MGQVERMPMVAQEQPEPAVAGERPEVPFLLGLTMAATVVLGLTGTALMALVAAAAAQVIQGEEQRGMGGPVAFMAAVAVVVGGRLAAVVPARKASS